MNVSHIRKFALGSIKDRAAFSATGAGFFLGSPGPITAFIHNRAPLHYLAYLEFEPGITRGDHLHLNRDQTLVVISGSLFGQYYLPKDPEHVIRLELHAGEGVWLAPGVAHSHRSMVSAATIEFSSSPYNEHDNVEMPFTWN